VARHPDDLALLPYTSGTTGLPKGCMHTHRTLMANVVGSFVHTSQDTVSLAVVPMFHITGMLYGVLMPIYTGATLVVMPRWDRELAGRADLRYRGVPGFHEAQPERIERQRLADGEVEAPGRDPTFRRETLQQRVERHQHDPAPQPRQLGERAQALGDDVRQRREQVPRQHLPVGQGQHRQALAGKESELGAAPLEAAAVGLDDQPRTIVGARGLGQGERRRAAVQARPAHERTPGGREQGRE